MAQDHHLVPARQLVVQFELTAEERLVAEQPEEPGAHLHPPQMFGTRRVAKLKIGTEVGGEALERLQLGAIVAEVRRRHRKMRRRRRLFE